MSASASFVKYLNMYCAPTAESIHTGNWAIPLTKTRLFAWLPAQLIPGLGSSFEAGVACSLAAEVACFFEANFTVGALDICPRQIRGWSAT